MRDPSLILETIVHIAAAGGFATRLPAFPRGAAWFAATLPLNGQAVADLLADGWLSPPDSAGRAALDAPQGLIDSLRRAEEAQWRADAWSAELERLGLIS
jgi:hypothetical protein